MLIAGGGRGDMPGGYISYDTAEMFDPATGRFTTMRARMKSDRVGAAAVKLNDGRVLIVGGKSGKVLMSDAAASRRMTPLNTAEIYDPESGTFIRTGDMSAPHYLADRDACSTTATSWWSEDGSCEGPVVVGMHDAEIFNLRRICFSHVGRTNVARLKNTATLLNDGEVLIAGGVADKALITASVEFYSPTQHRFLMLPETNGGCNLHASPAMKDSLPAFELRDADGTARSFPSGKSRAALLRQGRLPDVRDDDAADRGGASRVWRIGRCAGRSGRMPTATRSWSSDIR